MATEISPAPGPLQIADSGCRHLVIIEQIRCQNVACEYRWWKEGAKWVRSQDRENFQSTLNAWYLRFDSGFTGFVTYRFGVLALDVDVPSENGRRRIVPIFRYRPIFVSSICRQLAKGTHQSMTHLVERAKIADDCAELRELRMLNRQTAWLVQDVQISQWLETRARHFDMLSRRGWAGGSIPVTVSKPCRDDDSLPHLFGTNDA